MVEETAKSQWNYFRTPPQQSQWLSQTPNPLHIPEFYTLTKIHKPTLISWKTDQIRLWRPYWTYIIVCWHFTSPIPVAKVQKIEQSLYIL